MTMEPPTITLEQARMFLRMLAPAGRSLMTRMPPNHAGALAVCLEMPEGNYMMIQNVIAAALQRQMRCDGLMHLFENESAQSIIELLGAVCHGSSGAFKRIDY